MVIMNMTSKKYIDRLFIGTINLVITFFALSQISLAQTPDVLKAKLPDIPNWKINETVEVFNPDNLYDRINGAAPGYILFNFKELTSFEYNIDATDGNAATYVTIQIYRHATPEDAFGIYASERPTKSNFLTAGAEGYQEGAMLNFFIDNLYVKIESPSSDTDIEKNISLLAHKLGNNINHNPTFPTLLKSLPDNNKIPHSEMYIPSGFLGHEFLNKAYTANYEISDKKYQLFIIDNENVEHARATLTRYLQFTKQNLKLREGRLTIKDRFNGNLECIWKGRYIWGVINDNKANINIENILYIFST